MINISNLSYDYPNKKVLDNVSCSILPNTITALVGPNWAWKTTLFSCIAWLYRIPENTVLINSFDVSLNPSECRKFIAFLPDYFGLYESLTVYQCLKYYALAHKIPSSKIENRINEVLEIVNLTDKKNEFSRTLSRWMKQILWIWQVIISNPKVLLLDEPASWLDPQNRYNIWNLLKRLKTEGVTVLVSSHILTELDEYSDNMIILDNWEIISHTNKELVDISSYKIQITINGYIVKCKNILNSCIFYLIIISWFSSSQSIYFYVNISSLSFYPFTFIYI